MKSSTRCDEGIRLTVSSLIANHCIIDFRVICIKAKIIVKYPVSLQILSCGRTTTHAFCPIAGQYLIVLPLKWEHSFLKRLAIATEDVFQFNELIIAQDRRYHNTRGISSSLLSTIFSRGSYMGNSLMRFLRSLVQFSLLLRAFSIVFFASYFSP